MVKVLLAGLLAAEGAEAAQFFPPAGFRVPFLRSDNSGCCQKITIKGAKNENANGVYNAVMDATPAAKMANGFMYYMREDQKAVCHHVDKAWICASIDDCADPSDANNCANPMHGYSAIATNQGCIINQMTSTMAWQSAYDWLNRGTETFRIDDGFVMTCQGDVDECGNDAYNSCPTGSTCTNTVGGYDCTCGAGKTCEDFDQCGANGGGMCPEGSSCLEGSVLDENSKGYSCSCDAGYTHDDATKKCKDDNECEAKDFKGCDSKPNSECVNIPGGFNCTCPADKFSTDADGNCVDYDECANAKDDCASHTNTVCRNTVGAWECDCPVGFTGMKNNCTNIDECTQGDGPCGEFQGCKDLTPVKGSPGYECSCNNGFNTNADGSCTDINECAAATDPCADKKGTSCKNTDGSFECNCITGYKYDESTNPGSCKNIDECGDDFKDVNGTHIFCSENSYCDDNEGSFTCECNSGFTKEADGCVDINECNDKNADDVCGRINSTCENTVGGHDCGCVMGMALVADQSDPNVKVCTSIDYCNPTNATLKPDCAWTGANGGCENDYTLFKGVCKCSAGYQEGVDDQGKATCVDVDECKDGTAVCDKKNTECNNIDGAYECNCKKGWKLDGAGKECVDRNECEEAKAANKKYCSTDNTECINMEGRAGCACKPGYGIFTGKAGCSNKNECEMNLDNCAAKDPNSECKDEEGSFSCPCIDGFKEENGNCTNIDDCDKNNNCPANVSKCVDGVNSYTCECVDGWAKNETASQPAQPDAKPDPKLAVLVCYDVDECATGAKKCTDKPNEVCSNTAGLATCICADGWEVDATVAVVNQTCTVDKNECGGADGVNKGPCMNNALCSNVAGSYTCACSKGYKLSDDGSACNNVNECDNGFVCSKPNSQCVDNDGSAGCACIDGYHEVNQTCVDFDECKETSPCNFSNARCENTDASFLCHCADGYQQNVSALADDSNNDLCVNINECGDVNGTIPATHNCGDNQFCTDTTGNFTCTCNVGFVDVNAGNASLPMLCEDVDECKDVCTNPSDASSCTKQHNCDVGLNQGCQNLPGTYECGCAGGYEKNVTNATSGEFDCVDTNECRDGAHTCTALEDCEDKEGSFTCTCKGGYVKKVTNATSGEYKCEDVDECAKGTHECHSLASCSNTVGSYSCKCPGEYQGDGKQCLMCPSTECWVYNEVEKRCSPKDECSKLSCDGDGFGISFSPFLFGLKNDQPANWGSKVKPEFNAETGEYATKTGFGADYGMSYQIHGSSITFKLMISMSGNERVSHMRSDMAIDAADTMELGDRHIVVNPFGVGMVFQCTYPTLVKLSSVGYTVEDVSISSSLKGQGQWTEAFAMTLNNGNNAEFILGQVLPVSVSWKVTTMQSDLTFFYVGCTVTHGATDIAVIKDGCYAGATGSQPLASTPTEQNMSFKIFKGVNEAATEQTIECSVLICEPAKCAKPKSNADCPTGEHDAFYQYTFDGVN